MRRFALAVGLMIAIAVLTAVAIPGHAQAQSGTEPKKLPDMALGPPDAPITIVEYASPSCFACIKFYVNVFPLLRQRYIDTGKVRFIFREFPLDDEGGAISLLARCQEPDRYFDFLDLTFSLYESESFGRAHRKSTPYEFLKAIAAKAGMDEKAFVRCLEDEELLARLNAARKLAVDIGVKKVPAIFVNGAYVAIPDRPLNFADIERAIRNAR